MSTIANVIFILYKHSTHMKLIKAQLNFFNKNTSKKIHHSRTVCACAAYHLIFPSHFYIQNFIFKTLLSTFGAIVPIQMQLLCQLDNT